MYNLCALVYTLVYTFTLFTLLPPLTLFTLIKLVILLYTAKTSHSALHCLNSCKYASITFIAREVRPLLELTDGLVSKMWGDG